MLTQDLITSIQRTAGYLIPDMQLDDARNPEIVAEMVIDANRLDLIGNDPDADERVKALIEVHGYSAVLKEVAKVVPVA